MFEPTIALIESSLMVVEVSGPVDYRTIATGPDRAGFAAGWLLSTAAVRLNSTDLPWPGPGDAVVLAPRGHRIRALRAGTGQVWFDFYDLCVKPTSPADYAVIADDFPWWVVSGVPTITDMGREPARRFAHVIDVLYDRSLRLDLAVDATEQAFVSDMDLHLSFARTTSRVRAMRRTGTVST